MLTHPVLDVMANFPLIPDILIDQSIISANDTVVKCLKLHPALLFS